MILFLSSTLLIKAYSGGNGTLANPYQIANTTDLIYLSNHSGDWNKYFIQTADIVFDDDSTQVDWDGDGDANWDAQDQLGFSPIGNIFTDFQGNYNGQNHTISNLYINRIEQYNVGLFGYANGSSYIQNVGILNVYVSGKLGVGGLVGYDRGGSITNSYNTGSVIGNDNTGGLVGFNYSGSITNSYSTGSVAGHNFLGGLVGLNYSGSITNSFWDIQTSGQSSSAVVLD